MSKEFTYVDDAHLKTYLKGYIIHVSEGDPVVEPSAQTLIYDLMLTLEKDRVEATDYAKAAANHIQELIEEARLDAQRIERLETTRISAGKVADQIAKERDALLKQVAALSSPGSVQFIFKVEGDVHVTTPPEDLMAILHPHANDGDPDLDINSEG